MKRVLFSLAVILLFSFSIRATAQTAVYVCTKTGAFGYCYGNSNVSTCAYNLCISYGGQSPYSILNTFSKGYGAVAVGTNSNGMRVVGASAGYSNLENAKQRALNECVSYGGRNVYIYDWWDDQDHLR